ncbi:NAD dependent epimerase/dehydratase, putative [Pediculus humanus corporis]|uniref:NAD dependent epimerase/dehydratase, putative n=1 Tax=Pediculus humanus subsp. corporis TaxID=121224 RepID=E0VD37_PEDHC|nr:NAD dependent epimerase/dehydratase, putative [Pediculus humanus corporis]EEB11293.1 NAD dependent epimerase/dehydratase, putative [Pediculus humanus corporis]
MKPRVIILGGCGFIGRNLVHYLISNDLVECIRVVDKVPPQIAWLNSQHQASFNDARVHFKSCNLINLDSCKAAFAPDESNYSFDYVVNCAGETKPGQTDPVYKEGIFKLSSTCAMEAANQKIKHYVEISSGNIASSDKIPLKENCKKDPWTNIAKWKSKVEESLSEISGLNYTILRPGIVYGFGDRSGITPRLLIGAIYKYLGECMKLLWTKDLKMNTVHVDDLCRAIWFVLSRDDTRQNIYNVVDEGNSTQGTISSLVSEIFNINHDYWGSTISSIAKADLASAVEEINDKHLGPWAEICSKDGVNNTPLSPYIDKELLTNKNLFLDGSKLTNLGFSYTIPTATTEKLKEVLVDYTVMNLFPKSLIS